jgi:hypothetical protein
MIYLASPYSDPDPFTVETRYEAALKCFSNLCLEREVIFSPILMCHDAAQRHALPTDAQFWSGMNNYFLRLAKRVYVLAIPGWTTSIGVQQEILSAEKLSIPVSLVDIHGSIILPRLS